MPTVNYIESDGTKHTVELKEGTTLMQGAVSNGVDGIEAICGGCCACATCHCYVSDEWVEKLPEKQELELEMLEDATAEIRENSRLSCQIVVTAEMEGLTVHIPGVQ